MEQQLVTGLCEAILNDRRITIRNIIKWIHRLLNTLLGFHSVYTSLGDFDIHSIKIGTTESLQSLNDYCSNILLKLKPENADSVTIKKGKNKKFNQVDEDMRKVTIDLHKPMANSAVATNTQYENCRSAIGTKSLPYQTRIPREFDSSKIMRFNVKKDGAITVP